MGLIKRTITADASAVAMAIDATDIVSEIERLHKPSAVVTAALGRLSIAASMMGYGLKSEHDSVTIRLVSGSSQSNDRASPSRREFQQFADFRFIIPAAFY